MAQAVRIVLQLTSVLVLSRVLDPVAFGLFAMVVAVVGVAELLRDMGLSGAAIQASHLSTAERDNLFWLSTGAGLLATLLVLALAPLIAFLYGRPELIAVTAALAPSFVISGGAAQYRAMLTRDMRFGALGACDVLSAAIALAVGIGCGIAGLGVWSLVLQQLVGGVAALVLYMWSSRWLPGFYDRSVPVARFLRFGGSLLLSQMLTYTTKNIDQAIVGATFGARELGYYNRGYQLIRTPLNQLRAPIGTVAVPTLSRLQGDPRRYMAFVERAQLVVALPLLTALGWFVAAGDRAVTFFLGEQWAGAATVMRLVAVSEGLSTLMFVASFMYVSLGLGRQLARYSLFTTGLALVLILALVRFGPEGVASAYIVGGLITLPVALWQVGRATGLPTARLIRQAVCIVGGVTLASLASWGLMNFVTGLPRIAVLAVGLVAQVCVVALFAVVPRVRSAYKDMVDTALLVRGR